MTDSIQIPPYSAIPLSNTERAEHRSEENAQTNSDNDSDHGSDTSNTSRHDQTEARKAFRHVLQAPNPEKFAGDKKMYHLWKTALQSEVEHITMTPELWLKLLQTRTKAAALQIVQEFRRAQEMVGPEETLELIWKAFEKQYAAERTPGQDILSDLMTGAIINRSNSESF